MADMTTTRVPALRILAWVLTGAFLLALAGGGAWSLMTTVKANDFAAITHQLSGEHRSAQETSLLTGEAMSGLDAAVDEAEQALAADAAKRMAKRQSCLEGPMASPPYGFIMCDAQLVPDADSIEMEQVHESAVAARDAAHDENVSAIAAEAAAESAASDAAEVSAQTAAEARTALFASVAVVVALFLSSVVAWLVFAVARRSAR